MKESLTPEEPLYSKELAEEINKMIDARGIEDFPEAKKWLSKSPLDADEAKKGLTKRIVEILSQYLSNGLLQLTIEELINEKEYKEAIRDKKAHAIVIQLSKKLAPFKVYVDFVVKYGLMEIKRIRYDFKAESKVEIKDAKIVIKENRIGSVSFGTFIASITLYLLKGKHAVKIGSIERSLTFPGPITI